MTDKGADAATKSDLLAVEGRLDVKIDALAQKLDSSVDRLDGKIDALAQKLDSSVQRLDQKIDSSAQRLDQKIDKVHRSLAVEIVKTNERMGKMEERLNAKMDTGFARVMNAIDSFAGQAKHHDRAAVLHGQALTEVAVQLKDHEARIGALESARR